MRVNITHQRSMSPTTMGSATVVSELTFPGYRDQVSTNLPDALKEQSGDNLKAQADNVLKLMDRLADRYSKMAIRLGYIEPPKGGGQ